MKRVSKRLYAFLTAFLILFSTIFGNAIFVSKASEPATVSAEISQNDSDENGSGETKSADASDVGKTDEEVQKDETSSNDAGELKPGEVTENTKEGASSEEGKTSEAEVTEEASDAPSKNADSSDVMKTDDAALEDTVPVSDDADNAESGKSSKENKAANEGDTAEVEADDNEEAAVYSVGEKLTEAPVAGDKIFLVIKGAALTATKDEKFDTKLSTTTFSETETGKEVGNDAVLLEVEILEDGTYRFKNTDNQYLSAAQKSGNGVVFTSEPTDISIWNISKNDNDFNVINVNAEKTSRGRTTKQIIKYDSNLVTTSIIPSDEKQLKGKDYNISFYYGTALGSTEPETPVDPATPKGTKITDLETLENGTQFVVALKKDNTVMTTTAAGTTEKPTLAPVPGTLKDDKLIVEVEKKDESAELVSNVALLTLNKTETEGQYTITTKDGEQVKYLTTSATGNVLKLVDTADDYSAWNVELDAETQTFHIINVNAVFKEKKQAIEFYNGAFTTYSYEKGNEKTNEQNFTLTLYTEPEVVEKVVEDPEPEDPQPTDPVETDTNENTELKNGDTVVIWCNGNVLNTTVIKDKYLGGTEKAISDDGNLEIPDEAAVLKVEYDEAAGAFAFKNGDKYLTTPATGGGLSFGPKDDYSLWIPEKIEKGFKLKNAKAEKDGKAQYLEYGTKYKDFTTYGFKENDDQFVVRFFNAKDSYVVDDTTTLEVASWGGNATYESGTMIIPGDYIDINDMQDKDSTFIAVVSGNKVKPFMVTKGKTGSDNYYMGAEGIGSGSDDYVQFKMHYSGFGKGKIAFRLRGSGTSADSYQLKYSVDGNKFENFSTGKYSYSYTVYGEGGVQKGNVTKTNEPIKNGVAPMSVDSQYISFEFDIPRGADNNEWLYIRLIPSDKRIKASDKTSAITSGASLRVDSVKVTASPVVSEEICSYVKADPAAGAASIDVPITLSCATEGATIYYAFDDNATDYKVYDPENKPVLTKLPCLLTTYATKDGLQNSSVTKYKYSQQQVENVTAMPNGGAITENTQIKLSTKTEGAKIWYAYAKEAADENAEYEWIEYTEPFTAKELPCSIVTYASKEGCIDSAQKTLSFKKRLNEKYNIYFGQIHSHTEFSDGAGSCEQAFKHASTEVANLDYLAVTDHSNSLDNEGKSVISQNVDTSATEEWTRGHELAKQYSTDKFTCIYGYEMTWSNGLGHMNTYNTPGFQSRTQKAYSTYSTALKNYYDALNTVPDSVSMFNHPGTTFGDFQDFAYYSEANDELINLIEVGNGEGEIGSAGYFPSYEYYTRALDKGWHIAPTNNQDNHKGRWGDANTARTVALADANTESDIYDAMRNHRIYATEDNDLSIYYTLDGNIMGTILGKDAVGEKVHIEADVKDPTDGAVGKVSVIVNGGLAVASQNIDASEGKATFDIDANYSYYYLRIDQKDGNIAVTAPVWVGDVEACGINGVSTTTTLPVRGENLDINIDFYNNEKVALEIEKVTIDVKNAQGIETNVATLEGDDVKAVASIGQNSTASLTYNHVYGNAGKAIYTVTAYGKLDGVDKVYTGKLEVNYSDPQMVGEVIIDGSHYNDYVGGYYAGNMNNFIKLCAEQNLRAKIVTEKVTAETLKGAKFFVIAPPAGRDSTEKDSVKFYKSTYDDDFVNVVKEYVAGGGTVIIAGIADYNNAYAATEQNKLLTAIGSTISVNSDECMDDTNNGGQAYRLYPENFKADSPFLAGAKEGQKYSQYSGCSISFTEGENDSVYEAEKLVWGFDTTYSKDCKDENGNKIGENENGVPLDNKGNVNFLVHQKTKAGGDIFVAGGVFVSDFEVKAEMDNNDSLPYLNYNIAKNIIAANQVELPVSKIADMRKGAHGDIFAVEGYVTAGTDKEGNKFFDTIYIQDDTAGVTVFPVAETGIAIGTKVRITGFVDDYQGDLEIQAYNYKILDDEHKVIEPKVVSTKDAADYDLYGGSLLKTSGVVTRVVTNDAGVDYFFVKDDSGVEARVFIDGYILSSSGNDKVNEIVKEGAYISAVGLSYMNPDGATLRVRDRDEIVLATASSSDEPAPQPGSDPAPGPGSSESGSSSSSESGSSSSSESGSSQISDNGNSADAGNSSSVEDTSKSDSGNGAATDNSKGSDNKKNKKKNGKKNSKKDSGNNTNSGSANSTESTGSNNSQSSKSAQQSSASTASTSTVNSAASKTIAAPAETNANATDNVVAKADSSKTKAAETKTSEKTAETSDNKEEAADEAEAAETTDAVENAEDSAVTEDTEEANVEDATDVEVKGAQSTEINPEETPTADTVQGEKSGIPMPVLVILLIACLAAITGGAVVLVRKQNVK